jgi:hypothetical protein
VIGHEHHRAFSRQDFRVQHAHAATAQLKDPARAVANQFEGATLVAHELQPQPEGRQLKSKHGRNSG